jgi:hypothetical protein
MQDLKHDVLKELWYNRPWKYIPAVIRFMKDYPYSAKRGFKRSTYIRNCLYINWQVGFKRNGTKYIYNGCHRCVCVDCANKECHERHCSYCDALAKYKHSRTYANGLPVLACAKASRMTEEV